MYKKKMNRLKLLTALLVVSIISTLLTPFSTIAATILPAPSPMFFTVKNVKGATDKIVTIDVKVSENSQFYGAKWELQFDSSKLLFDSFKAGEILSNGATDFNANVSDKIIVAYSSLEPTLNEGIIFSVSFKIKNAVKNEKIDVNLLASELIDNKFQPLTATTKSGYVEVVDVLYGDLDLDNRVSTVDALKVLSIASNQTTATSQELKTADVNGDGKANVVDALQILYFSAEMGDNLYKTPDNQIDFFIYNLSAPQNVQISQLGEYDFTVSWDNLDNVLGYNVYLNGNKINQSLLTTNSVKIGPNGDKSIAPIIHNSIDHNSDYKIEITAVNSLKESEKSATTNVKTKKAFSYVTFKNWDGSVIGVPQKVLYGQDAIVPNNPTKQGYNFIGWDISTKNITEDKVITALFEIQKFNYTFKNWDETIVYNQEVTYGGTATPPANPTKTGYTFSGWFTAKTGGTKVTSFSNVIAATTVYAQFTINTYKVSFNSNGGSTVVDKTLNYNTLITAPTAPTKHGYVFDAWYKDVACTLKWNFVANVVTENTTLYAKWNPVVITITQGKASLDVSTTKTIQLSTTLSGGTDTIRWESSDEKIATVSETGLVTAVGNGTVNIFAIGVSNNRSAACVVTVIAEREAWCTEDGVNIRMWASTGPTPIVGVLNVGDQIKVLGEMQYQRGSGQTGWYEIRSSKGNGWVSANFITFTKPVAPPSGGGVISGDFATKLQTLRNQFPNGKYWNGGNANSCTNTPCSHHGLSGHACSHPGACSDPGYCCIYGNCGCNSFGGAIQCMGFAYRIFQGLYNKLPPNSRADLSFDSILVGDYLRLSDSHSVVVIYKDNTKIKVVECNFDNQCKITWDATYSKTGTNTINRNTGEHYHITEIRRA